MSARIVAIFGNLVVAETDGRVVQNSLAYCVRSDGVRLMSEVIRVRGQLADLQVFEETRGLRVGDPVELRDEMLSVVLGPGLLGKIYDGLQNPLPELAEQVGFFLQPGVYIHGLALDQSWDFTPVAKPGDIVLAGDPLGSVPEGQFTHQIMVPLAWRGEYTVEKVTPAGRYTVEQEIAVLAGADGQQRVVGNPLQRLRFAVVEAFQQAVQRGGVVAGGYEGRVAKGIHQLLQDAAAELQPAAFLQKLLAAQGKGGHAVAGLQLVKGGLPLRRGGNHKWEWGQKAPPVVFRLGKPLACSFIVCLPRGGYQS